MKLAIVGSRRFRNYTLMREILDPYLEQIDHIISGGAMGADRFAQRYAEDHGIPITIYYPKYEYGRSAPLLRNITIAENCDRMIAFAYPDSSGTRHVISLAREKGKEVVVIELEG